MWWSWQPPQSLALGQTRAIRWGERSKIRSIFPWALLRLTWVIRISQTSPRMALGTKTAQPSTRQTPIPSEE